jgi:hypothetical protein
MCDLRREPAGGCLPLTVQGPPNSQEHNQMTSKSRDQLTKATDQGKIELQEQDLNRVGGGLKIKLTQVLVSSYQLGASHGD